MADLGADLCVAFKDYFDHTLQNRRDGEHGFAGPHGRNQDDRHVALLSTRSGYRTRNCAIHDLVIDSVALMIYDVVHGHFAISEPPLVP